MLRQHHRFFQSSQVLRDAVLVAGCFWLAFSLRAFAPSVLPFAPPPEPRETAQLTLTLLLVWPWVGSMAGLYVSRRTRSRTAEVLDVTRAMGLAFVALVVLTYFVKEVRYSRTTLVLWSALAWATLLTARLLQRRFLRYLRARGKNLRHVVVVGDGPLAARLVALLDSEPALGLRVLGTFHHGERAKSVGHTPQLGHIDTLPARIAQWGVDQVIVALPLAEMAAVPNLMEVLSKETVDVRLVPDFYQFMTLCGSVEDLYGLPLVTLQATPMVGSKRVLKRFVDIVISSLALFLLTPLLIGVAVAIWIDDPGAIVYRQRRIGLDGQAFSMFKFRTMRADAEHHGARMTAVKDPRCTRLGRVLRRCSVDELPQLLNVLRGEMSLVGPRPEQPDFSETFRQSVPRYALRHKIKAGMTGWAQIHGLRGNTSIAKRIELDLYYIENWSLTLDVRILLRTAFGGFLSPHAY